MTFYNQPIRKIELEVSSFCNARCPQCVRESHNGDYSFFKQVNLSDAFFEVYFDKEAVKDLRQLALSGVVGEPAMNKHLLSIIRWFRKHNPHLYIEVFTNGGVQKPEWWNELGPLLGGGGNVVFAIDGLEDTNHIYRREVKWNQLMDNVKAYLQSGGNATWQFIPFKHNEHQVEQAQELSKQMGFTSFKIKKSHRDNFNQPQNEQHPVEPPTNPAYTHPGDKLNFDNMPAVEEYLDNTVVKCYAQEESSIYISAEGLVFPCCHTASMVFMPDDYLPKGYEWLRAAKQNLDTDDISLFKHPLKEIIKSKTFKGIKASWDLNMKQGKNPMCAAICGSCLSDVLNHTSRIHFQ